MLKSQRLKKELSMSKFSIMIISICALCFSAAAFADDHRLGGDGVHNDDAIQMFSLLAKFGYARINSGTGEAFVNGFDLVCADSRCMASSNFADPALGRREFDSKDVGTIKSLLEKAGFKPSTSAASGSNGVVFIGGSNVSCEVSTDQGSGSVDPRGFALCIFR
jgi:hypothetical protein